jgi:predicted aspartyl protease
MGQLVKKAKGGYDDWSTGSAEFYIEAKDQRRITQNKIVVGVQCRIHDFDETDIALLDTGAQWSVIGGEVAQEFENYPIEVNDITIMTRYGNIRGNLVSATITLLADTGSDLSMESTIFVSEEWPGPIVLGFRGFLEKLRIALDPGVRNGEQLFYFGLCE